MEKTTLTFYLPQETFTRAKVNAAKYGLSFSDLAVRCVLAVIGNDKYEQQTPPKNDEKAQVYLTEKEKHKIKLYAAQKGISISKLFYYALINENTDELPHREKPPDGRKRTTPHQKQPAIKHDPFTYYLTPENDSKLRLLNVKTGKSRKQLILDALKKIDPVKINSTHIQGQKNRRSSMNLSPQELNLLKKQARSLNLSPSDLINRLLEPL